MFKSTSESKYPNHSSLQCSVCPKNSITHSGSFQFLFLDDTVFEYYHGNAKLNKGKKPQNIYMSSPDIHKMICMIVFS